MRDDHGSSDCGQSRKSNVVTMGKSSSCLLRVLGESFMARRLALIAPTCADALKAPSR
jgi:hypothetical protein